MNAPRRIWTALGCAAALALIAGINAQTLTTIHSFTASSGNIGLSGTNGDGANPQAGLILSGNTLYDTPSQGSSSGNGTVFAINTDGTGFTILHTFTGGGDGASPLANLILSSNTLYGTTSGGGDLGDGTVFSLTLLGTPPQLTVIRSGANVLLTWPTNAIGFTLQSTTNLVSPAVWSTNSPAPGVIDGQNTVTNPISGTQQFFRLSQ